MDDNIIDLTARRNAASQPDPEFVRKDDDGRPLFCFLLAYRMDDRAYSTEIWAYDQAEAEKRVAAMRESLTYRGQLFSCDPA